MLSSASFLCYLILLVTVNDTFASLSLMAGAQWTGIVTTIAIEMLKSGMVEAVICVQRLWREYIGVDNTRPIYSIWSINIFLWNVNYHVIQLSQWPRRQIYSKACISKVHIYFICLYARFFYCLIFNENYIFLIVMPSVICC